MSARLTSGIAAILLLLTACSGLPTDAVVLIPDENGHIGKAIVSNGGGSVQLDRPFATAENTPGHRPVAITGTTKASIEAAFSDALAVTPRQPMIFRVYFANGQSALDATANAVLDTAIAAAKTLPNLDVSVVGYTDAIGRSADENGPLSLHRAENVRRRLVGAGVPLDMIAIASFGAENPAVPNRPGVPEPLNRRVEITLR